MVAAEWSFSAHNHGDDGGIYILGPEHNAGNSVGKDTEHFGGNLFMRKWRRIVNQLSMQRDCYCQYSLAPFN
jgi:hypothetical protein